jgi:hypothetical protein
MQIDHDGIGTDRDRGAGERYDELAAASRM